MMDPTTSVHQILRKSQKKCDRDLKNDWTCVWGRKHGATHACLNGKPNSPSLKKARWAKSKTKSMSLNFSDINRIVHKEFTLAG
jgi:hypothetical protein